jgi:radical SAM protein with 4Fe4S-binding SPASM domain
MIWSMVKSSNALKAGYSYLRSSVTGKAGIFGMPVTISTELTNHCNLKCPECNSGSGLMTRNRGYMDIDLFEKVIDELKPYLFNINLYFQGEPMLHPQFFSFIERSAGINSVVSTNGHFLSVGNAEKIVSSGLTKLIVSLDGMDGNTYKLYRVKGNFDQVMNGIKSVSEAKRKTASPMKLEIQFLVNRNNEHQIPMVKRYALDMKASLKLKSMQVISNGSHQYWLPSLKNFNRYKFKENGYVLKSTLPDRCSRLWFNPVITWDGKVVPCCFDKNADHIMGDVNEDTFREIWHGPKYRIFRRSILAGRYNTEICRNCTSGLKGVFTRS